MKGIEKLEVQLADLKWEHPSIFRSLEISYQVIQTFAEAQIEVTSALYFVH